MREEENALFCQGRSPADTRYILVGHGTDSLLRANAGVKWIERPHSFSCRR
jgi:hypothetical protein